MVDLGLGGGDASLSDDISALLRGEHVDPGILTHLLDGLQQLIEALSFKDDNDLSFARSRVRLSAINVAETLQEDVKCVAVNGRLVAQFRFGLAIYRQRLVDLAANIDSANDQLRAVETYDIPRHALGNIASFLQSWNNSVVPAAIEQLIGAGMPVQVDVQPSKRLLDTLRDAKSEQRLYRLEEVTSEWGKGRLAQTFGELGDDEADSAARWNYLVMLFVVLGIAIPLGFIYLEFRFAQTPTTISILLRTLIGLPMFALATYSGRISAQHRRLSQHMKVLVAQLDSVKAYVTGLEEPLRQEIIAALGRRAFSDPGVAGAGEGTVGIPPEDVIDIVEKAAKAINEIRK